MAFCHVRFGLDEEVLVNLNVNSNQFLDYVREKSVGQTQKSVDSRTLLVKEALRQCTQEVGDLERARGGSGGGGGGDEKSAEPGDGAAGGDDAAAEEEVVSPELALARSRKARYEEQLSELSLGWALFQELDTVDISDEAGGVKSLRTTPKERAAGFLDPKGTYTLVRVDAAAEGEAEGESTTPLVITLSPDVTAEVGEEA